MASGRPIDHIVLAVRRLDDAAATYEALGFTLTPRARHDDHMGTSNRLAQFGDRSFIEVLEVDRPDTLMPHGPEAEPPTFSFGAHNRSAVGLREGASMLVFAGEDARADIAAFTRAGIPTFAPFSFERQARTPDGASATVAFTLAFVQFPEMARLAFFVCENRAPEHFWKPAYQTHANGAAGIAAVTVASPAAERDAGLMGALFGGEVTPWGDGWSVACGPSQMVRVLLPASALALDPSLAGQDLSSALLVGVTLRGPARPIVAADAAHGMFLAWEEA
ncbi:MAG: VOC family protein [Pseudomonadota bacterium]